MSRPRPLSLSPSPLTMHACIYVCIARLLNALVYNFQGDNEAPDVNEICRIVSIAKITKMSILLKKRAHPNTLCGGRGRGRKIHSFCIYETFVTSPRDKQLIKTDVDVVFLYFVANR